MKKIFKTLTSLLLATLLTASLFSVSAFAANSYWGFDDYETITQPGAPAEITSYPTTITKVNSNVYTMTSTLEGGRTISISLIKEAWGTFNLGNWILTDNGKSHNFTGASTDMEYVHLSQTHNGNISYGGGNHGNEAFVSIDFYNAETGAKLDFNSKSSYNTNGVHVIEKTKLLRFNDGNSDSIGDYDGNIIKPGNYTDNDVSAEITRKYTFAGPQIKLNVDYKFVKDTRQWRSYNCMLPIDKKYSIYCDMIDKNGDIIKTITSRPYGDTSIANYAGPHNDGNNATRAVIYSKDYPNYQFDIRVNTYKDSLNEHKNATYKTSYWDMNSTHNKLYFTKYGDGGSMEVLQKAGTEYHTECIWMFRYDTNGRTPTVKENVALNKNYVITNTNNPVVNESANISYGALLTDGVALNRFDASNNHWFAIWQGTHTNGSRVGSVTIDLVAKYKLSSIVLNLCNNGGYGVLPPEKIEAFAKTDNSDFVSLGTFTINKNADAVYSTELPVNVEATQIKIEITVAYGSPCAYINEISAYGIHSPSLDVDKGPLDNLIRGLDYKISVTNEPIADPQWGTYYRANLTDGIAADKFDATNDSWFIYTAYKNLENGIGSFTVDLGKVCDITKIRLHLANVGNSMNVFAPKNITAYALVDGNYVSIGKFAINRENTVVYWTALEVKNIQTTSIKIEFEVNGSFAYLNEVEVHGTEVEVVPPQPEYLKGDVNNDGKLNTADYMMLKSLVIGNIDLTDLKNQETALLRSDFNGDGKLAAADYFLLKKHLLS